MKEVKAKGLPVLSYDRLVRKAGVDLYVSFDNEKVGSLMAETLARAVPAGGYVIINGARNDNNAIMLNAGIHKILDPLVSARKISIVGRDLAQLLGQRRGRARIWRWWSAGPGPSTR